MWTSAKAPSLAEMEAMAHDIFERLPPDFRELCEGVVIRVDDFPTDEVLDEMEAETEFDGRSWTTGPSTKRRSAISFATC
jgi:predicted Zn-dependent protease with MMP-like domain